MPPKKGTCKHEWKLRSLHKYCVKCGKKVYYKKSDSKVEDEMKYNQPLASRRRKEMKIQH